MLFCQIGFPRTHALSEAITCSSPVVNSCLYGCALCRNFAHAIHQLQSGHQQFLRLSGTNSSESLCRNGAKTRLNQCNDSIMFLLHSYASNDQAMIESEHSNDQAMIESGRFCILSLHVKPHSLMSRTPFFLW